MPSTTDHHGEDHGADPKGQLVTLGDPALPPVSMKLLQSLYNELTGKTEELEKHYDTPFQIRMADLQQLHCKMQQCCEQYDVQVMNLAATVYHLNDTSETFSSFDRFLLYNQSNTSPVKSVVLKYSILIALPKTNKPQNYVISVRLSSSIVVWKSLANKLPSTIFRIVGGPTAVVSISYVDYMVARNIMNVLEGWFDTLNKDLPPRWLKYIRQHSGASIPLAEYSIAFFMLWLILRVLPSQLTHATADPPQLARVLLVALSVMFLSYRFGHFIGHRIDDAIDEWRELGYIQINRGDEKVIAATTKENRRALIHGILALAVEFAVAVVAHLTALALKH